MSSNDSIGEDASLPELHESILDDATVEQLFRDLAACTEVLEVIPKFVERERAGEQSLTLDEGRNLLLEGRVRGIQVRYRYEGADWWDTLLRVPQGVRIVRIRHHFD